MERVLVRALARTRRLPASMREPVAARPVLLSPV